jgi:hypothetical protein
VNKLILLAVVCLAFAGAGFAQGQQFDAAFGMGTVTAPASASGNFTSQTVGGGAFPAFSADFLLKRHFGVGGEVAWRASQNLYGGFQPFRPIFYDFNGVWAPPLGKRAAAELSAGIGAESSRFYEPFFTCSFTSCTNYTSSNHFLGHFGGGLRLYAFGNIFVRPEAHLYLVHNNFEFSGSRVTRYGVSIGYSFRPGEE